MFAAADGYGAFEGDVDLAFDAGKGGFCASDVFRNDVGGAGRLKKTGNGALWLRGDNSYTGGTLLVEGTLGALSSTAFGKGDLYVSGGTLHNKSRRNLNVVGAYTQIGGELALELSGQLAGGLKVGRDAFITGGKLNLRFAQAPTAGTIVTALSAQRLHGHFDDVIVEGAGGIEVEYSATSVIVRITKAP